MNDVLHCRANVTAVTFYNMNYPDFQNHSIVSFVFTFIIITYNCQPIDA